MSCVLQISDLHFGTERAEVMDALDVLVARERPDLLLVTGDITQRARATQFAAAKAFIARLGRPALVLAGNHDIPLFNVFARMFWPYRGFTRAFGNDREPTFECSGLRVIGIDSTSPRRHKDGVIRRRQIDRVCDYLRASPKQCLRIVALHHPVHAITESDESNVAHGHREAVPAWAEAGADLILGGHIHLPYVRPLRERFAQIPRDVWTLQAGTAISQRTRGDTTNSVHLIRHDESSTFATCRVGQWDYDIENAMFDCSHETPILLDR